MVGTLADTREELDVLCRNRFGARALASSKASTADAGRLVLVLDVEVASDVLEWLVRESSAFAYSRFFVAIAVCVLSDRDDVSSAMSRECTGSRRRVTAITNSAALRSLQQHLRFSC